MPTHAKYWAVRLRGTHKYLPAPTSGRSATAVELQHLMDGPPRLFARKHHAVRAAEWWAQGLAYMASSPPTLWEPGDAWLEQAPLRTRPPLDMLEVVQVNLFPPALTVGEPL